MLFDEGMNFIENYFWSSTFINTKMNNILAVWQFFILQAFLPYKEIFLPYKEILLDLSNLSEYTLFFNKNNFIRTKALVLVKNLRTN